MPAVHYVQHPVDFIDIGEHVFPIGKYRILARLLRSELAVSESRFHPPDTLTEEDLARVHTPEYLDDLQHARVTPATLVSELPIRADVIDGFRAMAGGSLSAARLALDQGVGFHIGGGFHHAFPGHAEGFCYLHDVAIAVEWVRAEQRARTVLFVDTDVHQGNGTAAIYAGDSRSFTYSIHQERNYPVKQRSDLDRGLPDGVGDEEYLDLLGRDLDEIDGRFTPDLVCYIAGVDPFYADQLGGLDLTAEGLERRDERVIQRYVRHGLPVAIFLGGGYARSPEETARLHLGTARAAERTCVA